MNASSPAIQAALQAIDLAHAQDPKRENGSPAEVLYAQRLASWVQQLAPTPSDALLVATHAQHLERWVIARAEFPMDRTGYHRWRKAVQKRQGQRAQELMAAAGCEPALAARVQELVSKSALKNDPEAQVLEDAACLVFLASELGPFAAEHPDYTTEQFVVILRKSWEKMSPAARTLAGTIPFPEAHAALIRLATAAPSA